MVDAVPPGGLGGTFGGNPVACAAALAVLDEVATDAFRQRAEALGATVRSRLEAIAARVPQVGEVRGLGPMLAIELVEDAARGARRRSCATHDGASRASAGSSSSPAGSTRTCCASSCRSWPTTRDVDEGLEILEESLAEAAAIAA